MKCPHCSSVLPQPLLRCPGCNLSLDSLRHMLGSEWVRLERLTDTYACVSLTHSRHIETVLDAFERQFPQCFFAVYLGPIPSGLTPLDLGFWLLNYGAFNTQQLAKRNDYGIICIIDPVVGTVSLSLGYGLEMALSGLALEGVLMKMKPFLKKTDYAGAIEAAVKQCGQLLLKHATSTPLRPETSEAGSNPEDLGFQPLRARHTTTHLANSNPPTGFLP